MVNPPVFDKPAKRTKTSCNGRMTQAASPHKFVDPPDVAGPRCDCKDGCTGTEACKCLDNGSACFITCLCTDCANFMNSLPAFFKNSDVDASPCFRSWIKKECEEMGDEIDLNSQFVQDLLLDRLLVHCNHRNLNDLDAVVDHLGQLCGDRNYEQWYAMWYHPETSKIVKANLRKSLFQAGLGLGGLNFGHGGPDWFYSLCRQSWQQVTDTHHCERCEACVDWRAWHCESCNKCVYGLDIPCKCGGISNMHNPRRNPPY